MSSVSGLSPIHRVRARDLAVSAALLTIRKAPEIHYTQGGLRWQGIDKELKAWKGQYPLYADCSSAATWWLWQGLDHFGVRDVVNGQDWNWGYTGTMLRCGRRVEHQANWRRGDLFIYGQGWPGAHVAMYLGGGKVASHGSEGGPYLLPWNYRSDLLSVRRYI
jgi:hypothetical protein